MKQLSSLMLDSLKSRAPGYARKFLLYRKVWNEALNKYEFGDSVDITPFIIETGTIKWKLDNEGYSVWNNAGLSITISDRAGIFNDSDNSLLYGARIDVYGGVKVADGEEYAKIFRGFIMREPSFNAEEKCYIIYLSGELARLSSYSAIELSIKKDNILVASRAADSPGTQDTDYVSFTLADNAVGEISELRVGLIEEGPEAANILKVVNEYEVSSLNSYKYPAKITLLNPLPAGYALWASYRVWHTNKGIDWIIEKTVKLCDNPETYIENVNYDGVIESFFNQPSDADFLQGTNDYAEVTASSVTLPSTFLKDAEYDWTVLKYPTLSFHLSPNSVWIDDGQLHTPGIVSAPCSQAYGTWEVECNSLWNVDICQYYTFIAQDEWGKNGYYICHTKFDNFQLFFAFFKVVNGVESQIGVVWEDRKHLTYNVRYRICRYEDGSVRFLYKPLTPVEESWRDFGIVYTDNDFTYSTHHIVSMSHYGNNRIFYMKMSPLAATGSGDVSPYGSYYSPVIDGGSRFSSWKNFTASDEPNGGTCTYYTRSKETEESDWGSWNAINAGSNIGETGRYLQLKWFGRSDAAQTSVPKLKYWQAEWEAEGVNIAMINTSSMTCLDIVQELARLSGYQIGFDSEGTFFFKQRPALSAPSMKLTKSDIINIESINGGVDKLYNRVNVNFGNYNCIVDDFTLNKARPNLIDRYGVKELSLSSGALLPAQNANLARASAPGIFHEVSKIKKRAAVICRFLPQIELGDVIEIDYGPELSGNMMVEGLEFDLSNWTLRLDLCSWES